MDETLAQYAQELSSLNLPAVGDENNLDGLLIDDEETIMSDDLKWIVH